jgi:hypothetical protein
MKTLTAVGLGGITSVVAATVVVIGLRMTASSAEASPPPAITPADPNATPVLVELFTSEGCSSCPSADVVLARLARTQPVASSRVIVLAHHVDYWNQLGWPDPFSSNAASQRQRAYAPFGSGSYTPQAVIDGRTETVGSRGPQIEQMIGTQAKQPHAKIDIELTAAKNSFDVTIRSSALPTTTEKADEAEALLAIVQDRGRVAVPKGENSGRTLDHVGITRSLRTVGSIAKTGGTLKTNVSIPTAINAPDGTGTSFSIVAFIQERSSRHILGTNAIAVP